MVQIFSAIQNFVFVYLPTMFHILKLHRNKFTVLENKSDKTWSFQLWCLIHTKCVFTKYTKERLNSCD